MKDETSGRANEYYKFSYIALMVTIAYAILKKSVDLYFGSDILALAASIQDDSYYYLLPAYNAAHGKGFSFGGELAYGFQVGYELILVGIAWFMNTMPDLLRTALFTNSVFFVGSGLVASLASIHICRSAGIGQNRSLNAYLAGMVTAIAYFGNYWHFFNATTAKENALASLILSCIIFLQASSFTHNTTKKSAILGLACGLFLLTRPNPSTLIYVALSAYFNRRELRVFSISALFPFILWGSFSITYFGTVLPFSLRLKAAADVTESIKEVFPRTFDYLLTSLEFGLFGPSNVMIPQPNWAQALREAAWEKTLYAGIFLAFMAFIALLWGGRRKANKEAVYFLLSCVVGMMIGACATGLSLILKRPNEIYYASWYFFDSPVIMSIFVGVGLHIFLCILKEKGTAKPNMLWRGISFSAASACLLATFSIIGRYAAIDCYDRGYFWRGVDAMRWQNVMIAAGLWLKNEDKDLHQKRVAAFSAGALGFVLDDRAINLDGLANDEIAKAILRRTPMADYIRRARPDYFIDIMSVSPGDFKLTNLKIFPFRYGGYQVSRFDYSN